MEKWIRFGLNTENIPGYSCVNYQGNLHDPEQVNYPVGITFIAYGLTVELLHIIVLISIWRLCRGNAAYKIMFLLTIFNILNIAINSILTGIFFLDGGCYCTNPNMSYISGCLGIATWCGSAMCSLLLALNRFVDLLSSPVYGGWKIYLWLCVPVVYFVFFLFFTNPGFFNSKLISWFFSPFIEGKSVEEIRSYNNVPYVVNNLGLVVATSVLYVCLVPIMRYKYASYGVLHITKAQKSIMAQTFLICSASFIGALTHEYIQFFPSPLWMNVAAHVCWQINTGASAFVCLLLNGTIRRNIKNICCCRQKLQTATMTEKRPSRIGIEKRGSLKTQENKDISK